MPIIWPFIFLYITSWKPVAKFISNPVQKPWDWVFRKKEEFWVIVHLVDGRRIAGKYTKGAFASSYPEEEQIYLNEVWKLDNGKFIAPIERSKGIIILGKDISSVELFQ